MIGNAVLQLACRWHKSRNWALSWSLRTPSHASTLGAHHLDQITVSCISLSRKGIPWLWERSEFCAAKEGICLPIWRYKRENRKERGDTYNSASSWAKSVMMNIVDNGRKFSWRARNGIVSAVRRSLACGSGPMTISLCLLNQHYRRIRITRRKLKKIFQWSDGFRDSRIAVLRWLAHCPNPSHITYLFLG